MAPGMPLSLKLQCAKHCHSSNPWMSWPVIVGQRPLAVENFMWLLERAIWRAPILCVSAKKTVLVGQDC